MEFRPGKKGGAISLVTSVAIAFALSTYERHETPMQMPSIAEYEGQEDRHIENQGRELFIMGPSRDYGTDEEVRVWSFRESNPRLLDYEPLDDGRISCGTVTRSVLGFEWEEEAELNFDHKYVDENGTNSAVWCNRDESHPVEYFSVD